MGPVPDPLLLRKSGSAGNRTRDLCICSQKLWPLDHRGGHYAYAITKYHYTNMLLWVSPFRLPNCLRMAQTAVSRLVSLFGPPPPSHYFFILLILLLFIPSFVHPFTFLNSFIYAFLYFLPHLGLLFMYLFPYSFIYYIHFFYPPPFSFSPLFSCSFVSSLATCHLSSRRI